MKKFSIILLIVILLLQMNAIAFADNSYYLSELEVRVTLPDEFVAFRREVNADDKRFSNISMDRNQLIVYMIKNNIYLYCAKEDPKVEIVVTMEEDLASNLAINFNLFSDQELGEFADQLINSESKKLIEAPEQDEDDEDEQNDETEYLSYDFYKIEDVVYIVYNYSQMVDEQKVYIRQYSTVIDRQMINIVLKNYSEEVTQENAILLESIVENVMFFNVTLQPKYEKEPIEATEDEETETTEAILSEDEVVPIDVDDEQSFFRLDNLAFQSIIVMLPICIIFFILFMLRRKHKVKPE